VRFARQLSPFRVLEQWAQFAAAALMRLRRYKYAKKFSAGGVVGKSYKSFKGVRLFPSKVAGIELRNRIVWNEKRECGGARESGEWRKVKSFGPGVSVLFDGMQKLKQLSTTCHLSLASSDLFNKKCFTVSRDIQKATTPPADFLIQISNTGKDARGEQGSKSKQVMLQPSHNSNMRIPNEAISK
jgi:hypothetical protein